MVTMRRSSILLVAAGYGLSFLVVCLGTCYAATPAAEHACCAGEDGFRAADVDCCSVIPAASSDGPLLAGAATVAVALPHDALVSGPSASPLPAYGTVAPSPPLVLRI